MKTATPLIPRRQAKSESTHLTSLSDQSDQFVADKQGTQQHTPRISADSAVEEEVPIEVESKQNVPAPVETTGYQPHADVSHGNTEQDVEVSVSISYCTRLVSLVVKVFKLTMLSSEGPRPQ